MSAIEHDNGDKTSPDFVLDPSDPLYMLLSNTHDAKQDAFDYTLPMDFDFEDPSFSAFVNPNALFIDGKTHVHSIPTLPIQPQDLITNSFPFSFSSPTLSSASASIGESPPGLCPASPGSSSSTSASPPAPPLPRSTANAVTAFFSHTIGPFVAPLQSQSAVHHPVPPSPSPPAHTAQGPQTHVINNLSSRPKTSHTTIERRYRTNLNVRIQSLKAAVPALRILDQNCRMDEYKVDDRGYIDGVKVARKGSKANVLGKAVEYIRVLKRREVRLKREQDGLRSLICGFPGGQNILTAWEIEWTNKFGGPERDEVDNDGAEEASDDEGGDGDGEDDGDTSERARKKPKIELSKKEKRKIAPAAPVAAISGGEPLISATGPAVEKRKRGRPRKIQPNVPHSVNSAASVLPTDPSQQTVVPSTASQVPQPQQYLLAVFALFSFFNSPLTSTSQPVSHHHTYQGSVLSHATPVTFSPQPASGWTWSDVVQVAHLLGSLAVFVSIVVPWIPIPRKSSRPRLMDLMPFASLFHATHVDSSRKNPDLPTPPACLSDSDSELDSSSTEYTVRATKEVSNSDVPDSRGAADELKSLLSTLDISTGWVGMIRGSIGAFQVQNGPGTRRERRTWTRVAELTVLSPEKVSTSVRWQIYNHLFNQLGSSATGTASESLVSDLCTLALLSQSLSFAEARSQGLWARASKMAESFEVSAYQRLVLGSMTVEKAMEYLKISAPASGSSPIALLASSLLRKRLHSHAASLFIHRVSQDQEGYSRFPSTEDSRAWDATLSYGRSLGGDIGLLSDALAKVSQDNLFGLDMDLRVGAANEDVLTLLRATDLYGQVFTRQSVLSPLQSLPSKVDGKSSEVDVMLHLRRILGSDVFEESGEPSVDSLSLEDARDRVVDMIVSLQRERRARGL